MSFAEAMSQYGSDKPDLRVPLTAHRAHRRDARGRVQGVPRGGRCAWRSGGGTANSGRRHVVAQARSMTIRSSLPSTAPRGWPTSRSTTSTRACEGLQSPIVKIPARRPRCRSFSSAPARRDGDLIFFGADKAKVVNDALGALRAKIGHERGLAEKGWRPLWVVDFPMFEWNEEDKRWDALHHPFTSPMDGHEAYLDSDPGKALCEGLRHGAQRLGDRRRLGAYPSPGSADQGIHARSISAPKRRSRSSVSCWTRCSSARRPTAAWPSASIASSP